METPKKRKQPASASALATSPFTPSQGSRRKRRKLERLDWADNAFRGVPEVLAPPSPTSEHVNIRWDYMNEHEKYIARGWTPPPYGYLHSLPGLCQFNAFYCYGANRNKGGRIAMNSEDGNVEDLQNAAQNFGMRAIQLPKAQAERTENNADNSPSLCDEEEEYEYEYEIPETDRDNLRLPIDADMVIPTSSPVGELLAASSIGDDEKLVVNREQVLVEAEEGSLQDSSAKEVRTETHPRNATNTPDTSDHNDAEPQTRMTSTPRDNASGNGLPDFDHLLPESFEMETALRSSPLPIEAIEPVLPVSTMAIDVGVLSSSQPDKAELVWPATFPTAKMKKGFADNRPRSRPPALITSAFRAVHRSSSMHPASKHALSKATATNSLLPRSALLAGAPIEAIPEASMTEDAEITKTLSGIIEDSEPLCALGDVLAESTSCKGTSQSTEYYPFAIGDFLAGKSFPSSSVEILSSNEIANRSSSAPVEAIADFFRQTQSQSRQSFSPIVLSVAASESAENIAPTVPNEQSDHGSNPKGKLALSDSTPNQTSATMADTLEPNAANVENRPTAQPSTSINTNISHSTPSNAIKLNCSFSPEDAPDITIPSEHSQSSVSIEKSSFVSGFESASQVDYTSTVKSVSQFLASEMEGESLLNNSQ